MALLDAFLGYFAFEAVMDTADMQQRAQLVLGVETGVLVLVSILGALRFARRYGCEIITNIFVYDIRCLFPCANTNISTVLVSARFWMR